jgi:hypothetical protein
MYRLIWCVMQNFKRMAGNMFLGLTSRDAYNVSWEHIGYDPDVTTGKKCASDSACDSKSGSCDSSSNNNGNGHSHKSFTPSENEYVFSYWSDLAYDQKCHVPTGQFKTTSQFPLSWNLEADVVIVGSGSGGGTLAHELVKAGLDVLVLEKGGYFTTNEFKQVCLDMYG